jgi:hypothetical protein
MNVGQHFCSRRCLKLRAVQRALVALLVALPTRCHSEARAALLASAASPKAAVQSWITMQWTLTVLVGCVLECTAELDIYRALSMQGLSACASELIRVTEGTEK